MKTSIVIATYNKLEYTQRCIESIRAYTSPNSYEIIVVDNHSTDETVDWLQQQTDIFLISNEDNLGFPKACNQGIEIASGDNILLLNNDTIVTPGWLENLVACLYSSPDIGAVGPVTNNCSNYQQIAVPYDSIESMIEFAADFNKSDSSKWEERLRLIGYCMLIKNEAVKQIGMLDERFTPGNFEDDDYSHRLRLAGYRLILCRDTFIHHFGSTSFKERPQSYYDLIRTNRQNFFDKWGYDPYTALTKWSDLVDRIMKPVNEPIRVLEIGCRCGETLLSVKYKFPNAELYGLESNDREAQCASAFAEVVIQPLKNIQGLYAVNYFDVIIFGETFVQAAKSNVLQFITDTLKPDGQLIANIHNRMHVDIFRELMRETLHPEHLNAMSQDEIKKLLSQVGFQQTRMFAVAGAPLQMQDPVVAALKAYSNGDMSKYEIKYYQIATTKQTVSNTINDALEGLVSGSNVQHHLGILKTLQHDEIITFIEKQFSQAVSILNFIGVSFLEAHDNDNVLPYLQRAFEIEPENVGTLFNLGLAMYTFGQDEIALEWFCLIPDKDEQVQNWINQLETKLAEERFKENELKFILRRIEFGIEPEHQANEIMRLLLEKRVFIRDIITCITNNLIHKVKVLNILAQEAANLDLLDIVIPLYDYSLQMNPCDSETLKLLGTFLYQVGDQESALAYLLKINEPEESVVSLINLIQEASKIIG